MTDDPWSIFTYSLDEYNFPSLVSFAISEQDLSGLTSDEPRWEAGLGDQSSAWHRLFYTTFNEWRRVYDRFVQHVIAPRIAEPFYYQNVPTFRIHLPGNVAVGAFHTDAQYNHPLKEQTFWVPLTIAYDTNSMMVADDDDVMRTVDAFPGEVVQFSSATRRHGNEVNTTEFSRVSFDFRCLLERHLPSIEGQPSANQKLRFIPGEYYADKIVK